MQVSQVILNEWEARKQRGDVVAIHKATGLSRVTINKALNGSASGETIIKISEYYSDKPVVTTPKEIEEQALRLLKKKT